MNKFRFFLLATATASLILLLAVPHNAFAQYYNPGGGFYNPPGPIGGFGQGLGSIFNGLLGHTGGYYAGQQDAQFDYSHGYPYNDQPNCLPCHSEAYWNNFRQGYDQQWNTYQAQTQNTDQRTNIYINGNNNYVNTAQTSGQNQDQSQDQNYGQPESYPIWPHHHCCGGCDFGCGGSTGGPGGPD